MKQTVLSILMIVSVTYVFAQQTEETGTLIKKSKVTDWGFFVQGHAEASGFLNKPVLMAGGTMGFSINKHYRFGFNFNYMVSNLNVDSASLIAPFGRMRWNMNYGGVFFDYSFFPTKKVSLNVGTIFGVGSVGKQGLDVPTLNETLDDSRFVLLKPYVGATFNLTRFMAISIGGGYRFGLGASTPGVDTWTLSAPYGQIGIRFELTGTTQ